MYKTEKKIIAAAGVSGFKTEYVRVAKKIVALNKIITIVEGSITHNLNFDSTIIIK
jgi:hypothetical protein